VAFVDQGYTGEQPTKSAAVAGIRLEVVKLPTAKRSFAWTARFRRLARDYERLPETLIALHLLAFAVLLLARFVTTMAQYA
jgi:transposase